MKLPRRQFLHLAAGAVGLPAVSHPAWAQTYPARPVRLIVQVPAGSAPDIIARVMADWLSERLGQQFVIDNRPGASGNIATEAVIRAPADGYTLLLAMSANAINASLYNNLRFNFAQDAAPVAIIGTIPLALEINPSLPTKTIPEFIAYAKANPGKINVAQTGNGTPLHVATELFKMMAGITLVQVAYRGEPAAVTDLISGQVQSMFGVLPSTLPYIRSGQLRAAGYSQGHPARARGCWRTAGCAGSGWRIRRCRDHWDAARAAGLKQVAIPLDARGPAGRRARRLRGGRRRRHAEPPVPDRRGDGRRAAARAAGLGARARRAGGRGRLRRRVPLRPPPARGAPGARPGAGRLPRHGLEVARARAAARLDRRPGGARARAGGGEARRRRAGRPRSTSSRSPT